MKNYYLVRPNGEATMLTHEELNAYPFVCDDKAHVEGEEYSEDWQFYETYGTEWCVAYAENEEEAAAMVDKSGQGLKNMENVWCAVCGLHHRALAESA